MDSDEDNVEQGSTELKYLEFVNTIVAFVLGLLSNVYTFIKEHIGISEKTIASVESTVGSAVGPLVNKLTDFLQSILVFVDNKIDEYAPSSLKSLLGNLHSQITNPTDTANAALTKTKSLLGGIPILGNVLGGVTDSISNTTDAAHELIDKTTSLVTDNPLSQALNTAAGKMMEEAQSAGKKAALKSVYASLTLLLLPLIAEVWYKANTKEWFRRLANLILPLIEKLCNAYNDLVEKMVDKGYSFFDYLPTIPIKEMEAAYKLVKTKNDSLAAVAGGIEDVGEMASNIVGNIPLVGGIASSITETADHMIDNTASLVMDNPLSQAVESAADNMIQGTEEFATKAALHSVYSALTLLICPAIAEVCYKLSQYKIIKAMGKAILPLIEKLCEWYNQKLKDLDEQGYSFFGYLPTIPIEEMKVAYMLVKTANAGLETVGSGLSAVGDVVGLNDDEE
ncbi:hypothetical protein Lser_V15G40944 [Lactuca serriola]